ncbi:Rpn family recombination-promoting nuclease/putative transposase [Beggiatoa leptomitoformis]|uniref:Rpn family recombination-promoting nuclease/putative transposase n=1 Tax=Beggiatoa leptomitoformis TaxID=288004 RepID=A0A2N9YHU5_9GAMM|nr:Rpn family recombination-promoting nuclease/putative transposase [Beggiatoa leptomitoformis]ALG67708.1 Rpn family recombination-promoting nuclease/putative transposase [Beggiatoa leptomitoformis]AUI70054.1 Rpn family recombination-promoting nuclease/putative transposase [Beggiatoa leptomitoformis]
MTDHDQSYKLFFSHPEMVKDLLQGFVHEDWVQELDFSTLEKVSGQFTSEDLRSRDNDIIWRIRWQNKWLYVYILMEFQSSIDNYMAIRLMVYIGLLYQDLIKSGITTDKLPPVLPIVLYNGSRRWTAPLNVQDLIEPSPLQNYQPQLHYLLIDEGSYTTAELSSLHNLVAALFRIEKGQTEAEIIAVLNALIEWLKAPEQLSIRNTFVIWLKRVYIPKHLPDSQLSNLVELQEIKVMLAERVEAWYAEGIQKGREEGKLEGILEGKLEGKIEGKQDAVLNCLSLRFGKPALEIQQIIYNAQDTATLDELMKHALFADSLATFQQLAQIKH